jgi:FkbM family methyltransferase
LRQDLFCLIVNNWKEEGYFVDFGATNGIDINNTYILESQFNWTGILAEPSPQYHDELQLNRHTNIELNCVWEKSGELLDFIQAGELGQILDFKGNDNHKRHGNLIKVMSISLSDLLRKYEAPPIIDYLSIDTEGSEYNILRSLNFDQYRFNCISVEHNLTKNRELIFKLLTSHGYKRVLTEISLFDDWYVHHTSSLVLPS